MTGSTETRSAGVGHPAPGRERVGAARLVFSFGLAPVAWSIQLAALSSIAGMACQGAAASTGWADPALRLVNLGGLLLALAGLALSTSNMIRTWRAAEAPRGGVMMAGEGRAHWMAVGGFFAALLFLAAIAFNSVAVFRDGLCPL